MKVIILIIAASALTACATAYEPNSFWNDGGFTETEVQPGLFMVRFIGNEFTETERTADLAMLRAADLCLGRGMGFMHIGDVATRIVETGYVPGSITTTESTTANGSGNNVSASATSQTTVTPPTAMYSPQTGLTVACTTAKEGGAWDATFLSQSIRTKYNIYPN